MKKYTIPSMIDQVFPYYVVRPQIDFYFYRSRRVMVHDPSRLWNDRGRPKRTSWFKTDVFDLIESIKTSKFDYLNYVHRMTARRCGTNHERKREMVVYYLLERFIRNLPA